MGVTALDHQELALGIVIVFFDVLSILLRNHDLADFLRPIMAAVRPVWTAVPFIKAAFIVIMVWMAFRPGSTRERSAQRPLKAGIVHRGLPNAGTLTKIVNGHTNSTTYIHCCPGIIPTK